MSTSSLMIIPIVIALLILFVAWIVCIVILVSKNKNTNTNTVSAPTFCSSCGETIPAGSQFCPKCGAANPYPAQYTTPDSPSAGLAILGFFFPVIGLVLYLVFKDQTPLKAKSCGMGALTGFIFGVAASVIIVILYVVFIASMLSMYR